MMFRSFCNLHQFTWWKRVLGITLKPRRPFAISPFAGGVTRASTTYLSKHNILSSNRLSLSKTTVDRTSKYDVSESDSESELSGEEDTPQEVTQEDFAFFDPESNDFHEMKASLKAYLDDQEWDLSGFVDLILAQTTVGTVVKIDNKEEEGIFGFVSALNLGRYKGNKCITEVKDYLLNVCEEKSVTGELKGLLEDQAAHVGLVVSQRAVNLPPQLIPHLYDELFNEISWAIQDEPTEDLRNSYRLKQYLIITKIYMMVCQNKKVSTSSKDDDDVIYLNPEDAIFYELCSWSFTFPLHLQPLATPQELRNYQMMGLVMVVEADKAPVFRQKVRSLIDNF